MLSRKYTQEQLDQQRKTYKITFPSEVKTAELLNWLRQISGSLHTHTTLLAIPTVVFETWANDREITHRLSMPWQDADYIINQLQGLMPGIGTEHEKGRPLKHWDVATEYAIKDSAYPIVVKDAQSMSTSTLLEFSQLQKGESAILQWVISPLDTPKRPGDDAPKLLVDAFNTKFAEPNFMSSFRIAANASTPTRAKHLISLVLRPMASTARFKKVFNWSPDKVADSVTYASSPWRLGIQLSASELIAFMTWPIGSPLIAGLPHGASRHLPPTEAIPREGRLIGDSTYPGRERPIAMSHEAAATHVFVGGASGVGKTTLMANMAKQDMDAGHGVIVLEAKGDLFYEVLDYVPKDRLDDVVIIDFTDGLRPVGFNILDQGNPRTVIDELVELFQFKYNDKGVWFRELMFHGLMTLHEHPGMTFNDLSTLISPKDDDETAWAKSIINGTKDKEIKRFWHRWQTLSPADRHKHSEVVESRIWQIIGRIEPRYLFGQSESSFKAEDIIRNNKILLVNLSGVPKESAEIVGTLLLNALWGAAQRMPPEKENYLYMDEFQMFSDLPMGFDDVLALARKFRLGMVVATQYVERLPNHLQQAIKANARTKVIFQTNAEGARIWQQEFGSKAIDASEITNLKAHMAVARINTDSGVSSPVTIKTKSPARKAGYGLAATKLSNQKYGRSVADIETAEVARRQPKESDASKRPAVRSRKLR